MNGKSPITTHVLDTATGRPAAGVHVTLLRQSAPDAWDTLSIRHTDGDGRVTDLMPAGLIAAGRYRLIFATGEYHARQGVHAFFPEVVVDFNVAAHREHCHVPLLLSPFGYTTYRGS